jgi:hypothetical protein
VKLWLLRRIEEEGPTWDAANGFVVRAPTPRSARELVAERQLGSRDPDWWNLFQVYGDEGRECWLDPKRSSCTQLKPEGPLKVILRDFNAG